MGNTAEQASSGGSALRIEALCKSFGAHSVVENVTLDVPRGKLLSLLGPSGCGKTTTLRIVAGFESANSGRVLVDGRDITELPVYRRNLGMVFQNYSVFPHMTVAENVAFGLKMAGCSRNEIAERVRRQLDMVQMSKFTDRYPRQLSGGQQQRVALARSLITNPAILLLDEPFSALDKNLREGMQFELRELQRRLDITSIMVTHDQEEAMTMSDLVAMMSQGQVLQCAAPDEIYHRPATRAVAEFIGSINLFPCKLVSQQGNRSELVYDEGPARLRFAACDHRSRRTGDKVLLAVRPEYVSLQPRTKAGITATIRQHAFRGSTCTVILEAAGRSAPVVASYRHSDRLSVSTEPGTKVSVSWNPEAAVVIEEAR